MKISVDYYLSYVMCQKMVKGKLMSNSNEKPVKVIPKFFKDLLGNRVEPGDFVIYVNYDYKRLSIVKFLGYRTPRRAFFAPVGGSAGDEFYKENMEMIKVDLDESSDTYLRITEHKARLSDFFCQQSPKLILSCLTVSDQDVTDGQQEKINEQV
jgi:hypothetical protein